MPGSDFSMATKFPTLNESGFLQNKLSLARQTPSPLLAANERVFRARQDSLRQRQAEATKTLTFGLGGSSPFDLIRERLDETMDYVPEWTPTTPAESSLNQTPGGVFVRPGAGDSGLPGSKGTGLYGMQAGFAQMLTAFVAAARAAGHTITIGKGANAYRSYAEQVALKKKKPTLAATPGRSNHGWGLANDMTYGNAAARKWAQANAAAFGLAFPMSWENWHVEPANVRKTNVGGTKAPASRPTRTARATPTRATAVRPTGTTTRRAAL
jgi:hypothetical protein